MAAYGSELKDHGTYVSAMHAPVRGTEEPGTQPDGSPDGDIQAKVNECHVIAGNSAGFPLDRRLLRPSLDKCASDRQSATTFYSVRAGKAAFGQNEQKPMPARDWCFCSYLISSLDTELCYAA